MKKIFFILFFGFFGSLAFIISPQVFAQTPDVVSITPSVTPIPTPVTYVMPYAGLLPDNPLYKLKTLRDQIVGFLISDPLKKAEFDLLQSDKRVAASQGLSEENKNNAMLIGTTLSKADNYFSEGLGQLHAAQMQGTSISDDLLRFSTSNAKHLEILRMMQSSATGQLQGVLVSEEHRMMQFEKMVNSEMMKK